MKTYRGDRTIDGIKVYVDGQPLANRTDIKTLSRDGFEWSYEGEAPSQLALSLSGRSFRQCRAGTAPLRCVHARRGRQFRQRMGNDERRHRCFARREGGLSAVEFIETADGPIEVIRKDGAPGAGAIVLLHGIQGTSLAWDGVVSRLDTQRAIVRPNLRGRGRFVRSRPSGRLLAQGLCARSPCNTAGHRRTDASCRMEHGRARRAHLRRGIRGGRSSTG